jgi:ankyrin repeat protein
MKSNLRNAIAGLVLMSGLIPVFGVQKANPSDPASIQSPTRESTDASAWRESFFPASGTGALTPEISRSPGRQSGELQPRARAYAASYFGGSGTEFCEAVAVDGAGHVFVAGYTTSPNFPAAEKAPLSGEKGKSDVFILKFDKDLTTVLASARIGGAEDECAYSILYDPRGFVYVAGYTGSKDFPVTPQSFSPKYNGGEGDAFLLKMDDSLTTIVASTFLGGSGKEDDFRSPEIVQDKNGRIYFAGITDSADFPTTPGAFRGKFAGGDSDVFLAEFDPSLKTLLASTLLGGRAMDRLGRGLAIDPSTEEIVLAGYTVSPDFPLTPTAFSRNISGNLDGFIVKFSPDLTKLTASTILEKGWIYCLLMHGNGDIYIGGHGAPAPTAGAYYRAFDKQGDQGFISRFSNDLSALKSSTVLPGSYPPFSAGDICSLNLVQSPEGDLWAAGWAGPKNFPTTPGAFDETQNGGADMFVLRIDPELSAVSASTFIGGEKNERWNRMARDNDGTLLIASYTASANFPTTPGSAFEKYAGGTTDGFVVRINPQLASVVAEEFHEAAEKDRLEEVRRLFSSDRTQLEKTDRYQRTPLHSAARHGALAVAEYLMAQGANLRAKDEGGNTPLHLAAMYGHEKIVERLAAQKADLQEVNNDGLSPLAMAVYYGNRPAVGVLLSHKADPNTRDRDGNTALHTAALYGQAATVREILKYQSDVEVKNKAGQTPLHLASGKNDNQETIGLLLERGADLKAVDETGKNAFLSSASGNWNYLRRKGADVNSRDRDGNTALHLKLAMALRFKQMGPPPLDTIRLLLAEGADPTLKNNKGQSPLDIALEIGDPTLIELLKTKE